MPYFIAGVSEIGEAGDKVDGSVTLVEGTNVTITRSGQSITIASSGGGGGSLEIQEDTSTVDASTTIIDFTEGDATLCVSSPSGTVTIDMEQYALLAGRSGGQDLSGGTASTENLTLAANDQAYLDTNTGEIKLQDRMAFSESFTVAGASLNDQYLTVDPTITTGVSVNVFIGYLHAPVVNTSVAQALSQAPAFKAQPRFTQTSTGTITDTLSYYTGFDSVPQVDVSAASGTWTPYRNVGYAARPQVFKTGSANITLEEIVCFGSYILPFFSNTDIAASTTVNTLYHFRAVRPVTGNGTTVTNNYGITFPSGLDHAAHINNYIFHSNLPHQNASTLNYNLYFTGTAKSFMQGGLRIGDSSPAQPTEKLEVLGNVLLDNGGSSSELRIREPSGGGSSYTGFKAPALSGNVMYTLPTADGSANQLLQTNGSGVLSWATVSGASTPDSGQVTGGVNGLAGNATEGCSYGGHAACNQGPVMPVNGEFYAMSIANNAARTAGTATAEFYINGGSVDSNTVVLDGTNTQFHYNAFGTPVSFSAGDRVDLQVTTSSWNPTGSDPTVVLFWRST